MPFHSIFFPPKKITYPHCIFTQSLVAWLFLFCLSVNAFAQTAQPRYPINGDRVSPNPKFTAVATSLVSSGVTYNIVVSEQPRGGGAGVDQYIDFWVKEGVPASSLLESNLNRLGWDSTWIRKTRNGTYIGTPTVIPNATPAALAYGKKYYWHIVGTNRTKSAESTFTVIESARPLPTLLAPVNGAAVTASSQNPCFSWSMGSANGFSNYTITVSTSPDFPTSRWHYQITSISTTNVCWNNGAGWAPKGTLPPPTPGPLQNGVTYYWRVLASYTDGAITGRDFVGRSFTYRAASSSSVAVSSSSRSSSSVTSLAPKVTRYTYDARGRVTKVMRTGGGSSSVQTQYTYDKANNRRTVITTGSNN